MLCQNCQRPLTLCAPRFCPVCTNPPNTQAFDAYTTCECRAWAEPLVEADQNVLMLQGWLRFMHEVSQIRVEHAPPGASLDKRVKPEWDTQRQWNEAVKGYKAAVPQETSAAEFCFLLQLAAASRVHHLRRLMTPQTAMELLSDTYVFERFDRMWEAGIRVTIAGRQTEAAQHEIVWQAVQAMRQELFDSLAWQQGVLQEHPRDEVKVWGSIIFAGVMRSMIRLDFPGLWTALAQEGKPEEVLLKRLPPIGYASWYDGPRKSLEAIRDWIVRVLKQNDNQAPRDEKHTQRDAFDQVPRDALSLTPDDTLRLLKLEDLVKASCRQAGLTEYETDVAYYKLQDYPERVIAVILGHSEDGITQAWRSGRTKLQTVFSPEEWRRLIM